MSEQQANDPQARADQASAGEDVAANGEGSAGEHAAQASSARISTEQLENERAHGDGNLFPDAGSLFEPEPVDTPEQLEAEVEEAEAHDTRFATGPDESGVAESNFGQNTAE
ncbi:hypothetical protein [Pseudoclavibacter sp. VKM Ac-2867]|uniref:hypothetical protein n=1 Tax=Pseudoclavibacter sp. VKM Ac-2867 TaxID=2783829 RepID=UPI00188D5DE7|nr:hypothetical protein [Pseudoclavibacter sp. VKM Ac-2867]MBF4457204.1 hypothetical protein [Pseudoclavibacter sp. VKM Ac-2867]